MRAFSCDTCGEHVYFDNSVCISCDSSLAWSRDEQRITGIEDGAPRCTHLTLNGCNWLPDGADGLCFSCRLTRTRPSDEDVVGLPQYYVAEQAKRRLVAELDTLGLPVEPRDPATGRGVTFDLLSSVAEDVVTGHADGVVTIDLAESDDVHRERVRVEMGEAYRTMLGHLRHEIGHYYEMVLVTDDETTERARALFGDERADYQAEIDRHYADGPPDDWPDRYVSAYATMHPFEDFAETFAHVLHVRDGLETAHAFGLIVDPAVGVRSFADVVVGTWLPLTRSLNQMSRSMGQSDLYPFVLSQPVVDKLSFVHELVTRAREQVSAVNSPAIRTVSATRYVAPLREGGSLPGIVEADDLGTYVCKFRGAGQGPKVLVAEVIVGELARRLEIATPDLVVVELDAAIGRYEADEEVQDLLTASIGANLGVDFLPGSFGFDSGCTPDPEVAARILWLDALTANVDRSWRNPNLLVWHGDLWAIDHGACLWFHHGWSGGVGSPARFAAQPYDAADHVLGAFRDRVADVDDALAGRVTRALLDEVVALVPDEWLEPVPGAPSPGDLRAAYVEFLHARVTGDRAWLPLGGAA